MERRIAAHLATKHASRAGMPLDDERKFWNGLVHLCLFFATLTLTLALTLTLTLALTLALTLTLPLPLTRCTSASSSSRRTA